MRFVTGPALAGFFFLLAAGVAIAQGDAKRGEYLAAAGGCIGCHTETREGAVAFSGGRALKTPFGTFYGPNLTPDPQAGIGRWSAAEFVRRELLSGVSLSVVHPNQRCGPA